MNTKADPAIATTHAIVLFDGACNFCNSAVRFIIDRDRQDHFRFAALQSEIGRSLLSEHGLPTDQRDTMVLIEGTVAYTKSTAALRIARRLRWPWPLLALGMVVPHFLRDLLYDWVARHRHRWLGTSEACRPPTESMRQRFLSPTAVNEPDDHEEPGQKRVAQSD